LSDPREKQPLKETLKSVRYQCECTSKAAYQVVEVSQEILSELKSHKETMTEQTRLLKLIAGNQVDLSKLLKGTATTGGKGQAQPGTAPAPSGGTGPMPAAHAAPLGAPDTAPPPRTTSRTKAAIRPQRHTVGKKPQTRRGKWYMQLTATADLSEAFRQLPMPMIKRGR